LKFKENSLGYNVFRKASLLFLFCLGAWASSAAVVRQDGTTVDTIFQVKSGGKTITCGGPIKNKYHPGRTKKIGDTTVLILFSEDLKVQKAKYKTAKKAADKKKISKTIDALLLKIKLQKKICAAGPNGSSPTATPTQGPGGSNPGPVPTATRTPTPTPRPSSGNFDNSGNTTAAGNTKFGIPSNLTGNISQGSSVYSNNCKGCHSGETTGHSFSYYKSSIQASPMFIFNLSDGQLANLTAYLRRFEPG